MEYIWIIIGDRAECYFGSGLSWAFKRGSDCTCSTCIDWGPSVAADGSQVTDLLSWAHTCLWEQEDLLLSCHGFRLFLDRLLGVGIRWRSEHHTETGSQVLEAWSPSLDGDLDPVTREWWVGPVCAYGTSGACVSGYPAVIHWFANRSFCETVPTWLWSSTVVRTGTWKVIKWFWLLTTCLKSSIDAYIEWIVNELMMTVIKI